MVDIEIVFSQHVMDQMVDRGTSEEEIKLTIRDGEEVPAKKGSIIQPNNNSNCQGRIK